MKQWANYRVHVQYSAWGKILYASSIITATAMAKHYSGTIERIK
jgi:hypothetical protein